MDEELKAVLQQMEKNRKSLEELKREMQKNSSTDWNIWLIFWFLTGCLWLLILSSEAKADTFYLGQRSHHFNPVGDGIVRESHALAIYEHSSGWMAGYWRNSYNRDSYALGYHYYLWKTSNKGEPDMSMGLKGGIVSGYNIPVFGAINVQMGYIDVNIVPSEVISVGLKFDW